MLIFVTQQIYDHFFFFPCPLSKNQSVKNIHHSIFNLNKLNGNLIKKIT